MVLGKSIHVNITRAVNAAVSFDDKMMDGGGSIYRYVAGTGSIYSTFSLSLVPDFWVVGCWSGLYELIVGTTSKSNPTNPNLERYSLSSFFNV